ncbi:MAG: substrate-binding domain-containing protein [Nitrososphaeria archaeon]|nr:substrate-binding domain-containing protein [Conexivisphaerales archaeon]
MKSFEAIAFIVIIIAASLISYNIGASKTSQGVYVISASLYAPVLTETLKEMNVSGSVVSMGSVAAAQNVLLTPSKYALFLSVDPAVIEDLLYPKNVSSWYIALASDQMVIGVSSYSPEFDQIKQLNASLYSAIVSGNISSEKIYLSEILKIVLSNDSKLGTSNPNTDPEGYRALMMLQLSSMFVNNNRSYYVNDLQRLNISGRVTEVPMGSALFAYLQSGEIYYDIALYRSSAVSHRIPFIILPPQVNLGSANFSAFYSKAEVTITSGGQKVDLHGAPIYLSLTIPNTYPNGQLASSIALFLISPQGKKLLESYGVKPLSTAVFYGNPDDAPQPLRSFINSSVLAYE